MRRLKRAASVNYLWALRVRDMYVATRSQILNFATDGLKPMTDCFFGPNFFPMLLRRELLICEALDLRQRFPRCTLMHSMDIALTSMQVDTDIPSYQADYGMQPYRLMTASDIWTSGMENLPMHLLQRCIYKPEEIIEERYGNTPCHWSLYGCSPYK